MRKWFWTLAIALGLLLASNIAYGLVYVYRTQVSVTGTVALELTAGLSANPTAVDFAGFSPGQKSPVRKVTVTNTGPVAKRGLTITTVGLPNGVTALSSQVPDGNVDVPPGGTWETYLQLEAVSTITAETPITGVFIMDAQ